MHLCLKGDNEIQFIPAYFLILDLILQDLLQIDFQALQIKTIKWEIKCLHSKVHIFSDNEIYLINQFSMRCGFMVLWKYFSFIFIFLVAIEKCSEKKSRSIIYHPFLCTNLYPYIYIFEFNITIINQVRNSCTYI